MAHTYAYVKKHSNRLSEIDMKKYPILPFTLGLLLLTMLACGQSTPAAAPPPTPDTQATVDAAVAATRQVETNAQATADAAAVDKQATVDAAIAATSTAQAEMQAAVDAAVEATRASEPTPTPAPEYVAMTEEEIAAAIDQAAAEAAAATQEASSITSDAAADGTVTEEEIEALEVYLIDAETAIAYTEELLYAYYGLYGELALETLYLLEEIEEDLLLLAENAAAIDAVLQEIDSALEQGMTLNQETLDQLEELALTAYDNAAGLEAQNQDWQQALEAELQQRANNALAIQPNNVPDNRRAAIQSAAAYLEATLQALADNKISPEELANLAQLGANAAAGLNAQGGLQLQQLAGSINQITAQMAGGSLPQAKAALGSFESVLNSLPSLP